MSNTTRRFMMGAAGAGGKTNYVEDNFSTQLYKGTAAAQSIVSGVDLSTDGGLVITKSRTAAGNNWAWGSPIAAVGTGKYNRPNTILGVATDANSYTAFNDDGYTIGSSDVLNESNEDFVSYSFKKTPGLIDVISYVGNDASSRVLNHDLGSVPGCIAVICTTKSENKTIWHRGFGERVSGSPSEYYAFLDGGNAARNSSAAYPALPTATQLTIGSYVNINGETYVAYIFGGGESNAATARSVDFSSNSNYLNIADSTDFDFGSTFTFEVWVKPDFTGQNVNTIYSQGSFEIAVTDSGMFYVDQNHQFFGGDFNSPAGLVHEGQWTHLAIVVNSGVPKMYVNGIDVTPAERTGVNVTGKTDAVKIARSGAYFFKGEISNLRAVKGTAVYASSFRPPTEPLTNITNTVLLCCNNSSVTGATVTPNTITTTGSPTASTNSPFDDPEGFKFGEEENQSIIECGSYTGNGSSTGPEVYLGWEPQWILIKNGSITDDWYIFDSMRGVATGSTVSATGYDARLKPNSTDAEDSATNKLDFTSTGFKIATSNADVNGSGNAIVYMCLRRSDGYVGKPAKAGTDVFDMKVAQTGGSTPYYQGYGFVVDSILTKAPTASGDFSIYQRLTGKRRLETNTTIAEANNNNALWDYMNGFNQYTGNDGYFLSWGWKRHAGFDVVSYDGNGSVQNITHNLSKIPEMIWIKGRNISSDWVVYHKGQNGGTNPEQYHLHLDSTTAEVALTSMWNDTAPTSTQFTVGSNSNNNGNTNQFIAMLFARVDGISKVGYYTGTGSAQTITLGFQPRFFIIKKASASGDWYVVDTLRGWPTAENYLQLQSTDAQGPNDFGSNATNGITLSNSSLSNNNGDKYIYYAHA